jgi:MFS family permease
VPIILPPYYILESQEQWYPPGFAVFLGLLPDKFIKKYYWLISPALDALISIFASFAALIITKNTLASFIAGLICAFSISSIIETQSLTSRQLGSLLLNIAMYSLFWTISNDSVLGYILFFVFGYFLLMTHKMGMQSLLISLITLSLILKSWPYLGCALFLVIFSVIASKGFYLKILAAHKDILSFWNKNWFQLGAHQIYHSPIYGEPKEYKNTLFHPVKMIRRMFIIFLENALIIPIILFKVDIVHNNPMLALVFLWVIVTLVSSYLIILIPQIRLLGEGHKYLKYATPSIAILAAKLFISHPIIIISGIIYYFFISTAWLFVRNKKLLSSEKGANDNNLGEVINYLCLQEHARIICVPNHLSDTVAYHTKKQVFWGTHNYPFRWVSDFIPVWRRRLSYFKNRHNLTHLLIDGNYANPAIFAQEIKKKIFSVQNYEIYEL